MIKIDKMETSYPGGEIFSAESLSLSDKEITTIIGRNGSGKSTLMKAIAGILPYRGQILIDGKESRSLSHRQRAKLISYLPQSLKAVNMDTKTLVEHGRFCYHGGMRRISERDRQAIDLAIDITEMREYMEVNLREMSGGIRQRAYLAMVIAQDTPMILLDEPTTYLDICYQKMFYDIIERLKNEGKGIVMACHDIEQSFSFSDRIVVMDGGRAISDGTPEELSSESKLMREVFGVCVKYMDDPELLHPYRATK